MGKLNSGSKCLKLRPSNDSNISTQHSKAGHRSRACESTHLVESVNLHCEAVDARHGRHGLQLWDVRGQVGLEGNIVEKFVTYVRLFTILQRKHKETKSSEHFKLNVCVAQSS